MSATVITIGTLFSFTTGQLLFTIGSIAYQQSQAKKMKSRMRAAEESRKGFEFTRKSEAMNLPVIYGYNKVGGLVTDLKVQSSYTWVAPNGYSAAQYLPSPTTYDYNSSTYFVESKVTAADVSDTDNPKNISSHTVRVIWAGVELYNKTYTNSVAGLFLSTEYKNIENELSNISAGGDRYYRGSRKDKIVSGLTITYKYEIRKVLSPSAIVFGSDRGYQGSKNEVLLTQNAISFGGINALVDLDIDETTASNDKFKDSFVLNFYKNGGVADPMATANGFSSSNLFTSTAYATCAFVLNRDDPQYSGNLPSLSFYVEGQRIYDIIESNGVYSLSAEKTFSNNFARVLLDYLINGVYGRGLSINEIDLESFYRAKVISDTVVDTKPFGGKVYGGSKPTTVKLYEFNDIIDTEQEVRDNVNRILQCAHQAFLVWSDGRYKLNVEYPTGNPSVANGLVNTNHVFTDADIVRDSANVTWPKAEDKYNQVTVRFSNAIKNFKSDSITWPETFSQVYNVYLGEDNDQPLKTEVSIPGIIDPYHAQSRAEELVRTSRNTHRLSIKLTRKAITLETGDFFLLKSEVIPIKNLANTDGYEIYRVQSVEYDGELNVKIEAQSFNYLNLAWNIGDFVAYPASTLVNDVIKPPTSVLFTNTNNGILGVQSGKLTWTKSSSVEVDQYLVEVSADNNATWTTLGQTYAYQFDITGLSTGVYSFAVRAITPLGRKSPRAIAEDAQGNSSITIQRGTPDKVAVIYANSADELTNNQSYSIGSNAYVAYYVYKTEALPTLPIRAGISFARFVGLAGSNGYNTAIVTIYQKNTSSSTPPADPTGTFTYTFSSVSLTGGTLNGWTTSSPSLAQGEYLWVKQATAYSQSNTDSIAATEFSSAVVLGVAGKDGFNGLNSVPIFLYIKSTSGTTAPTSFTGTATYTFSTKTLSGLTLNSWTQTAPSLSQGEYLWVRQAIASSSTNTDTISIDEWSAAAVVGIGGSNGANGATGATGARGPGLWRYDTGASNLSEVDTTAEVDVYWYAMQNPDIPPVKDDRFIIATTHSSGTKAFIYSGTGWVSQAAFIDGNLLVNGTVTTNAIYVGPSEGLSNLTSNAGTITAGVLRNNNNTFVIDLTNGTIKISV